jgi:alpha-beta hydrolase superfamily lysophospholipase
MKVSFKKRTLSVLIALVFIYLAGGIVLYLVQDQILFHPKALPINHQFQFNQSFEEFNIPFKNENLNIVKFKPIKKRRGIILFYHGNVDNVEQYKQYPSIFLRNDYEFWIIDYPGFGKTTGRRTEKIIDEQALLMYNMAIKEINIDSIIIYGKSIGTGVASFVASEKNCSRLILETPYYNIPSLAKHFFPIYPVKHMIRYSFPVNENLKKVRSPITIFHGTKDEIIPYQNSKRLKQENEGIELITIEKGKHNNLWGYSSFQNKLDSLLFR